MSLEHIAEPLRALAVPIDSLVPDPANARKHDQRNLDAIKGSLRRFGQRQPLVVQRAGMVVRAGNARLQAAKELGWTTIAALVVDEPGTEATAYAIADNRTAELAEWDDDVLGRILQQLREEDAIEGIGYTDDEIEKLVDSIVADAGPEEDEVPETPTTPVTQPGDLWVLGDHRVFCGDSFHAADRDKLIGGQPIDCVVTDPPYAIYGSSTGVSSSIADDKMVRPFFAELGRAIRAHLKLWGHAYTFCDWRSWASVWEGYGRAELTPKNCLIWDKNGGLGSSYAQCYGMVAFFAHLAAQKALTDNTPREQRTVLAPNILRHPRVTGDERQHNAAKPVDLLIELISNSTDKGETVLDLFGGSGSTLIAAERSGRRALVMEMEPKWCDVIVRRWETATGKQAVREAAAVRACSSTT